MATPDAAVPPSDNRESIKDPFESSGWIKYIPKAFGLQESVRNSPYRWCFREAGLWGVGTASAMFVHRIRMGSRPQMAGHFFFGTLLFVMTPSYYFCYRQREHKEKMIEAMMKYNKFKRAEEMPAQTPLEEHPFWQKVDGENSEAFQHEREFRGMIKERKEWEEQQEQGQDLKDVLREKK